QVLKNLVVNRKIRWSPRAGHLEGARDDTLAKELARLVVEETRYGYRFDHESSGHDDRAAAIGMGLMFAVPEVIPTGKLGPKVATPRARSRAAGRPPGGDGAAARGLFGLR